MVGRIYKWIEGQGAWGTPANWDDISDSQNPSLTAPGTADTATIVGPATATTYIVTGPGSASFLTLNNSVALAGDFNIGAVTISTTLEGTVNLLAGAVLATGSLVTTSESLSVNGAGAELLDSGTFSLQGFSGAEASDGGFIQTGPLAIVDGVIAVDPAGTFEIGTAGGAAAGVLTEDAGATLEMEGQIYSPAVIDGLVNGGGQTFAAPVSGTGTISVGSFAHFDSAVAAGVDIVFPGFTGDVSLSDPADFAATVAGFRVDDTLAVNAPGIDGLSYSGTTTGGTLTLLDGTADLGTIALAGNYTASTFLLLPFGGAFANANITLATNQATTPAAAPADPGNANPYSWGTDTGGNWNNSANWGGAAPPGSQNAVTIASAIFGYQVIDGDGNSASMTFTGETALNGTFNTGTLTINITVDEIGSTTDLLPGSVVNAASASLGGAIDVDHATFDVSGTMTFGNASLGTGTMSLLDHGFARAGTLALGLNTQFSASLGIDPTSAFEVGSTGAAAPGALTVDQGSTVDIAGEVDGNVVNNGLILASNGPFGIAPVLNGAISGTGTIVITAGASLQLEGNFAAGGSIDFEAGAGLRIQLPGTLGAVLFGFAIGDTITSNALEVAGAAFDQATGALVLTDASATPLVTLDMAGSFAGNSFLALPTAGEFGNSSSVVLAAGTLQTGAPPTPVPGTAGADTYTWTATGGAWGTAANWSDTTAGQPVALFAPGSNDVVTIPASTITPTGWDIISGAGNAASLAIAGNVALSGNFSPTALTVTGSLDVTARADVTANAATITGNALVDGIGASLAVAGVLSVNGDFAAAAHASVTAGGLASTNGPFLYVDPTATVEIGAAGGAVAGALNIDASITAAVQNMQLTGNLVNNGTLSAQDITLPGNVSGSGVIALGSGAFSSLTGSIATTQTIALAGSDDLTLGTLSLPTITGFAPGDQLEFAEDITGAAWNAGTLTLSTDGVAVATLAMPGPYNGANFVVTPDPGFVQSKEAASVPAGLTAAAASEAVGRSIVVLASTGIACFATGTRIATAAGAVAVEHLQPGDRILTAFGGDAPVRWLGHRTLDCRRHPRPADVLPVRVRAGAVAPNMPVRDLVLSPDHAVYIDGALIPIRYLINGASIVQEPANQITYWHVELPTHDIILAEGLPSESYLDTGNRDAFLEATSFSEEKEAKRLFLPVRVIRINVIA